MGDQLHGIKPTEGFPKKGNVKRLFIFKINCTSIPGAFLTRENMASQYCVKPHYTEQGCSLSSRFCKSTLHLGRVQWGQDEILYMGVIDWAHLLLHSCCFWANSQIHLAGLLWKYFSSKGNVVYHLFHCFFFPVTPVGDKLSDHEDNVPSSDRKWWCTNLAPVTQS